MGVRGSGFGVSGVAWSAAVLEVALWTWRKIPQDAKDMLAPLAKPVPTRPGAATRVSTHARKEGPAAARQPFEQGSGGRRPDEWG